MSQKENTAIEARLRTAVSDLPGQVQAEKIWEQPVEKAAGDEWYLEGTNKRRRALTRRIWSIPAAAAAVLVFVMFYYINLRTDAVVFLDVNPSVQLEVNSREIVTEAKPCNEDGAKILQEMDLRRTDLDVAVNALIGSMIRSGYLTEVQDTLLLSVNCTDAEKKEKLRQRLSGQINDELLALLGKSSVFDQDVEIDDDLEDLAERYGITPGKAALIKKLIQADSSLSFEMLAGMPMDQLADYLKKTGLDLRDYIHYLGDDDDWDDDDLYDDDLHDDDLYDDDLYDDDDDDDDDWDDDGRRRTDVNQGSSSGSSQKSGSGQQGQKQQASSAKKNKSKQQKDDDGDWDGDDWDDDDDREDDDWDDDDDDRAAANKAASSGGSQKAASGQQSSGGSSGKQQAEVKKQSSQPTPSQKQESHDDDDDDDDRDDDDRDDDDDDDDD